jgi:hypothetical protein
MDGRDSFWYADPSVLWKWDRIQEFFPNSQTSLAEQLNALVRLAAYASVILYAYSRKTPILYVLPATLLLTKVVHDVRSRNDVVREPPIITGGYGVDAGLPETNVRTVVNGQECVAPTLNNPFGNVSIADIKYDPDRPPACDISDPAVKKSAMDAFYDRLFVDADDTFDRNSNSRQFMTMPRTTLPGGEQKDFALWCGFGNMGRCKQTGDVSLCTEDDVRANRSPHFEFQK